MLLKPSISDIFKDNALFPVQQNLAAYHVIDYEKRDFKISQLEWHENSPDINSLEFL